MNLREAYAKFKNAKYMWDMTRVDVMIDANNNSWIATKDYEYLAKRYKSLYFNMSLLMVGIFIFVFLMMW